MEAAEERFHEEQRGVPVPRGSEEVGADGLVEGGVGGVDEQVVHLAGEDAVGRRERARQNQAQIRQVQVVGRGGLQEVG